MTTKALALQQLTRGDVLSNPAQTEGLSDSHYELVGILADLKKLGATVPSFSVHHLSDHEAATWLRSERRRLEHLARAMGEQHS